jgi:hypothetical protein
LKGKSTETALHDLVYKLDGSLAQKKIALSVFFDVKGLFDNTSFESMDDAAGDHGVCTTINRWIDFMLRLGSVFIDIRGLECICVCHVVFHRRMYYRPYSGIW